MHYAALNDGVIRAVVRLALWVLPGVLFVRFTKGPPVSERLGFRHYAWRGILTGLTGLGILLLTAVTQHGRTALLNWQLPTDAATWLNPVLTAPLAEEVLFRGVIFRVLRNRHGVVTAIPTSAALFALVHLPYWAISGDKSGAALVVALSSIFAYGLFFATLFQWARSLWAPLLCHGLNNLLTVSLSA
jgi:membrane protease YdiL (CAAX protease family)